MEYRAPNYVFPVRGTAWSEGIGRPVGVFFLDGRCHFATDDTPAAEQLSQQGALRIGTVRFDGEASEARGGRRTLTTLAARAAVRRYAPAARN